MQKISFVIPCYRSQKTLPLVVEDIENTMRGQSQYSYELVLVNDCSPDGVWETIQDLAHSRDHIIGVNLAKNFGQDAALMAGYRHVTGDIVVSLDDDGQNPASEVMSLLNKLEEGYDVVFAAYRQNMESAFRRFGSLINSVMAQYLIGKPRNIAIQSFYAAKRYIIDEIVKYDQAYPYVFGLIFRTTQSIENVEVTHRSRNVGTSGYTLHKLLSAWMNGFTAFSVKPLRIASIAGAVSSLIGFLMGIYFIVMKFLDPTVPMGYSSLITSIVFFSGLIMLMLGMLGEYIGRLYICINRSPQYVVKSRVYSNEDDQRDEDR